MILSFRCKETEELFCREYSKKLPQDIQRIALRKLLIIDAATDISDLRVPPGNRLELLTGDRKGQYSIRVNQKYRICFKWDKGNVFEVEIVDYH